MVDLPNHKPIELKVTNFGPITKAEIQLRPLTVFIGPNRSVPTEAGFRHAAGRSGPTDVFVNERIG